MSTGALVLIAIATIHTNSTHHHRQEDYYCFEMEAYLRVQLEHMYGQVLFTLTNHVQILPGEMGRGLL